MHKLIRSSLAAGLLAAPMLANAEISANVALTSDYVWRGVSQTLEDPAIQGGFDYAHDSGLAAGVWASNVDFYETGDIDDDGADMELDLYASYGGEFGNGIGYSVGLIYYMYPETDPGVDIDWLEFNAGLSYGPVSFAINYTSDFINSGDDAIYYSLGGEHEINGFTLAAAVGYYDLSDTGADPDGYVDWKLGVSTSFVGLDWDLSYTDTNGDGEDLFGDLADGRAVLTVSKSF